MYFAAFISVQGKHPFTPAEYVLLIPDCNFFTGKMGMLVFEKWMYGFAEILLGQQVKATVCFFHMHLLQRMAKEVHHGLQVVQANIFTSLVSCPFLLGKTGTATISHLKAVQKYRILFMFVWIIPSFVYVKQNLVMQKFISLFFMELKITKPLSRDFLII